MEELQKQSGPTSTEAAAAPAAATNGFYQLESPITVAGGKTITELNLNFKKIKAKGWLGLDKQFTDTEKKFVALYWTDSRYQLMAVAKLNGLIFEDLFELDGGDYVVVTAAVKDFFTDRLKES